MDLREFYESEAGLKEFLPDRDPYEQDRVEFALSLVPALPSGSRLLDVGCGDGYLCSMLGELKGGFVVGGDLSYARMLRAARRFTRCRFVSTFAHQLAFRNDAFDLVSAVQMLEHTQDPGEVLRELVRVSRRFILLTVPHEERLETVLCPHCARTFYKNGHIQSFSEADVRRLCEAQGLRVVKVRRFVRATFLRAHPLFRWLTDWAKETVRQGMYRSGMIGAVNFGVLAEKRPNRG